MRARLVPIDNSSPVELTKDLMLVGRTEDCDLRLDHKSVSKLHCVLVKTDGLVLVRDLGSTNGTRVNGTRVRRAALLPNDHLAIAGFKYQVKLGAAVDDPPTAIGGAAENEALPPADDASEDAPPEKIKLAEPPVRRNALPDVYQDADRT